MRKIASFCKLLDCNRKHDSHGYCAMHARRISRYGDASIVKKHVFKDGRWKSPEYRAWMNMHQRCYNKSRPQYNYWGGRGIKVCDRWSGVNGFFCFYKDMGAKPTPEHSLDRIDNDGNYEPENCRWATKSEQLLNRRPLGKFGVTGVSFNKRNNKYTARKYVDGTRIWLGSFSTLEEAVKALSS